jgi:hypothetical protein
METSCAEHILGGIDLGLLWNNGLLIEGLADTTLAF